MATITGKASEFITFSRTSNATLTDSDGLIKWAPNNLILASEQFDASNWTKTDVTITANAVVAPNGTTTADALLETATTATHRTSQSVSAITGATYRIGCFVRPLGRDWGLIQISTGATDAYAFFNITTGVVGTTGTGAINPTISRDATTGWCYISLSVVATASSVLYVVEPRATDGGTTYLGDITKGIYLWGAHVYRSDLGGMKSNTSAYPLYNPTTAKNLLGFSEDFSNAGWTKTGLLAFGSGSVSNAILAPNGLQTADKITEDTTTGNHRAVQPTSVVSGTTYVFSVYAKAAGRNFIMIQSNFVNNAYGTVNLLTGATNLIGGTGTLSAVDAGDGWWRVSLIAPSSTTGTGQFYVYTASDATTFSFTGDGTSGVYLWGAQLSDSASLDTYVPNYGAAPTAAAYYGPRLDYDPVTLAAEGLLVEEARTNGLTGSNDFSTTWGATRSSVSTNVSATTAPDGTQTADKLIEDTTAANSHVISRIAGNPAAAGTYNFSVYLKAAERRYAQIMTFVDPAITNLRYAAMFDLQTGTVTSTNASATPPTAIANSIQAIGNGWYRCTITVGNPSGLRLDFRIDLSDTPTATVFGVNYTGDGTSGIYLWGAQLELGSFATSYIPTGAATATRNADVASVSTQAFPYSAAEGTIVVNATTSSDILSSYSAAMINSGVTNIIGFDVDTSGSYRLRVTDNSVNQALVTVVTPIASNTNYKTAGVYKANDFAACANGGSVVTDTSGTVPADISTLFIGCLSSTGTSSWNGHIRQITYIPRRLSDTELQTRTT